MRSHARISTTRWTLLALLLALPVTVVCKPKTCTDCEESVPADPASYETGFGCDGGFLTVTAGTDSDVADLAACFTVVEAAASDVIDGIAASVEFLAQHGGDSVTLTCSYDIAADLPAPLHCDGGTLRPAEFFYGFGTDPVRWQITALSTAVGDSVDLGTFDPHVFVTCPGSGEVEIAIGETGYITPDLPLADTQCDVRVEMNSAASAAGATIHSVTLTLGGSAGCSADVDCASGLRCRNGTCQDGGVGDACASSYLAATGGGDCGPSAPICVTGPGLVAPRCSNGSDGSACAGQFHCPNGFCFEFFPGLGLCQDGSALDLCRNDSDCDAGCDCVNLGGSSGGCLGGCAIPGDRGSYCTAPTECALPFGCVTTGPVSFCFDCTLDSECTDTETCVAGECVPGS